MLPGFGLGRLHHVFSRQSREQIVFAALDAGFRHFDLAPAYGDGLAERELGRMLGSRRNDVTITTKFGIPFRAVGELPMPLYMGLRAAGKALRISFGADYSRRDFSPKVLVSSLEASLRRLRTPHIDYLLVHEPLSLAEFRTLGETWAELDRQKQRGKVKHFGVSGDTAMILDAEKENLIPDTAVRMVPMNETSCAIPLPWFSRREVFIFNIIKHLRRAQAPASNGAPVPRLDTRTVVDAFAQAFPVARPIFATHDLSEIKRLGEVTAARRDAHGAT